MSELPLEVDTADDAGHYFIVVPKGEPWLTEEQAKEIKHRADCHDELVDVLKKIEIHSDDPDMARLAKAALAKAKKLNKENSGEEGE